MSHRACSFLISFSAVIFIFASLGCSGAKTQAKSHADMQTNAEVLPGRPVNVLTYHDDNARTGQNLNEKALNPRTVHAENFGKIGFLSAQGKVDAEPLYVTGLRIGGTKHNVVFVVTEHDLAYAFDADKLAELWRVSLLGPDERPSDDRGCGQVTPEIGVTSTPVIDLKAGPHGAIFLVAMSKDSSGRYFQRLHALDITTGRELPGSPAVIQATFPGTALPNSHGQVEFEPKQYKERAGLLLLGGDVYLSWASHCDFDPYTGWVMAYDEKSLQQKSVLNIAPNGSEAAIWMSGAGLASDGSFIYPLAGNGTFDTTLDSHGFPDRGDFGNSFLKIGLDSGKLAVADYFTMHNTIAESSKDLDLGSGGALVLPDMRDSSGKVRHLAAGAGKDDIIYVADRDNMGKFNPEKNEIYQEIPHTGDENSEGLGGSGTIGVYSMPAYFNHTLYFGAVNDSVRAFRIENARVVTPASSKGTTVFGYPGTTPSISANGNQDGIVWALENNSPAVLHAYDANDLAHELYNSNERRKRDEITGNKFITPMIANGKVFVGTPDGVAVFGILPKPKPPAHAPAEKPRPKR